MPLLMGLALGVSVDVGNEAPKGEGAGANGAVLGANGEAFIAEVGAPNAPKALLGVALGVPKSDAEFDGDDENNEVADGVAEGFNIGGETDGAGKPRGPFDGARIELLPVGFKSNRFVVPSADV